MANRISMWIYFSLTLLNLLIFLWLTVKYLRDENRKYKVHSLTKLLAILTLFLFLDSLYLSILATSSYRVFSDGFYMALSQPSYQVITKLGLFASVIFIVYFIMEKRIEEFKNSELGISKLEKMNHELEKRARELSNTQNVLQKKVQQLERFNDIAKEREEKMLDLINKIDNLEKKLKKKKA